MNIIVLLKAYTSFNKLKEAFKMKDWKTTLAAFVVLLGFLFKMLFKADIPQEVSDAIMLIGTFFIGFFAKDSVKKDE